ncbi:MAG: AzlC family ABC transporter permease [Erysipelotrichales bacterium]|nr:AzlC family ABC transporter permease [Bacilli bacterium]MEA4821330.1 AzlC family ABC transporter permease [Erysipelotrichales bacterium]
MKSSFKKAFFDTLPVLAGFIVLGIAYGMLFVEKGYQWYYAVLSSLLIYAGSAQFVAVSLLATDINLINLFLIIFVINIRYIFYGISMLNRYNKANKVKSFLIFGLTDETFALLVDSKQDDKYMFFVTLLNYIYWALGTFVGSIIGSDVVFNTRGLDFILTALFVTIFINQWRKSKNRLPLFLGFIISGVMLIIFKNYFILPALLVLLVVVLLFKNKLTEGSGDN